MDVLEAEIGQIIAAMQRKPLELRVGAADFRRWPTAFNLLTMTDESDCSYLFINDVTEQIAEERVGGYTYTTYFVRFSILPLVDPRPGLTGC